MKTYWYIVSTIGQVAQLSTKKTRKGNIRVAYYLLFKLHNDMVFIKEHNCQTNFSHNFIHTLKDYPGTNG